MHVRFSFASLNISRTSWRSAGAPAGTGLLAKRPRVCDVSHLRRVAFAACRICGVSHLRRVAFVACQFVLSFPCTVPVVVTALTVTISKPSLEIESNQSLLHVEKWLLAIKQFTGICVLKDIPLILRKYVTHTDINTDRVSYIAAIAR